MNKRHTQTQHHFVNNMAERINIQMYPDYGDSLFWDEEGCSIGGCGSLYLGEDGSGIEIDLSEIEGLKKWYYDWYWESLYQRHHWTDNQWREWWTKGMEYAKAVNELLPDDVDLYYFSLDDPLWTVRPEDTDDGGLFNEGEPIKLLKAGTYIFECFIMDCTEYDIGPDSKFNGNNPIKVSLELSYNDIQSIIDMMNWAWDNGWFYKTISDTGCTELLKERLPHMYSKVYSIAHQLFCAEYPNCEHLEDFGVFAIYCPDEIVEFTAYSRTDYYMR